MRDSIGAASCALLACTAAANHPVAAQKPVPIDATGWAFADDRFAIFEDTSVTHGGHTSIHLVPRSTPPGGTLYVTSLRRYLGGEEYGGKRIRLSTWTKSAHPQLADRLKLDVVGPPNGTNFYRYVSLDAGEWRATDVVVDVPEHARTISYSFEVTGEVWIEESPKVEIVSDSIPLTTAFWPAALGKPESVNAKIISVECGPDLEVTVHFTIDAPTGIIDYGVFTPGGPDDYLPGCYAQVAQPVRKLGCEPGETFAAPLPTSIDRVVKFRHGRVDHYREKHRVGLSVTTPGDRGHSIRAYGDEPDGICPGHDRFKARVPCDSCSPVDGVCVKNGGMCMPPD